MGHLYREKAEIPIPARAHINHNNAQVSIYELDANGHRTGSRTVIGLATSDTTMHPNENFRLLFPDLWEKYYAEQPPVYLLHVGLYAALLGLGHQTGIYPLLDRLLGHPDANAVMDFAMYSISKRSCNAQSFEETMHDKLLFSAKTMTDSSYCTLFKERLAAREQDAALRLEWLKTCALKGEKEIWLCIDSSNNDCRIQNSNLAEPGKAKSLKNVKIISYIWAVSADSGRPAAWWVNNGVMHDSKAFDAIIKIVDSAGLKIKGVILDKGFASQDVVNTIRSLGLEYVIKLTDNDKAHKEMLSQYASDVRLNVNHAFTVNGRAMFGITARKKIFESDDRDSTVGFYYDCINGAERSSHLVCKVIEAAEEVRRQIVRDPNKAAIPTGMHKYLKIETDSHNIPVDVSFNHSLWQTAVNHTGFSTIACSLELNAAAIDGLYDLRDVSEKQFSILKSQLGFNTTRAHSDNSIKSRLMTAFVAAVLRTEFSLICRSLGLDANVMLRKLNRVSLIYMGDGRYKAVRNLSNEIKQLLERCGITEDSLDGLAVDVNNRKRAVHSDFRQIPTTNTEPKKAGRPPKPQSEMITKEKRKPGRPKGSKNKATLEREAREAAQPPAPKRKPGRPKGSKNKKTLERERRMQELGIVMVKRKPGRPKGSKNKKTLAREAEAALNIKRAEQRKARQAKKQAKEL